VIFCTGLDPERLTIVSLCQYHDSLYRAHIVTG